MIHWEIDSGLDLLAIVAMVLILVGGIILIILRKNIRASLGKYKLSATDTEGPDTCPPNIQREHEGLLAELRDGQDKILALLEKVVERVNATDESQGALISQAAIMQKFVRRELGRSREGDEINGDLDEADDEIRRAKDIYRSGRRIE